MNNNKFKYIAEEKIDHEHEPIEFYTGGHVLVGQSDKEQNFSVDLCVCKICKQLYVEFTPIQKAVVDETKKFAQEQQMSRMPFPGVYNQETQTRNTDLSNDMGR